MADEAPSSHARHEPAASKRSSMACTTCRQVKLRCDATKRYPAACSRCERQGKACLFDPAFKRRQVRGALEKVTEEKEQLRKIVDSFTSKSHSRLSSNKSYDNATTHDDSTTMIENNSYYKELPQSTSEGYGLDGVYLERQTVQSLFDHFTHHHYPHLPIVNLDKPTEAIHNESQLLFWTIIVITARDHVIHRKHYVHLEQPFKNLLSGHLIKSIRSMYTVQSLLLLSLWPFPVRYQTDDPSWTYCSMAVAAALQLGLDDPQTQRRRNAVDNAQDDSTESLRTWLGCFVVSSILSADLSLPSPICSVNKWDEKIQRSLDSVLPETLVSQVQIQLYSTRTSVILGERASSKYQSSLIGLVARDLKAVASQIRKADSIPIRVDILAAELRLYSLPLLSKTHSGVSRSTDPTSMAFAYKGFHVALQLVEIFSASMEQSCLVSLNGSESLATTAYDQITVYYPKHYFRVLVMAGMYLLNLLITDREMSQQDERLARGHINQVYEALKHWSQQDIDEADRAARMIELLSRHVEDLRLYAQSDDENGKENDSIIAHGMKIARKIRTELQASAARGAFDQVQSSEYSPDPTASFAGSQLGSVYLWGVDLPSDWESWLLDADPIVGLLESQPDQLPMNTI